MDTSLENGRARLAAAAIFCLLGSGAGCDDAEQETDARPMHVTRVFPELEPGGAPARVLLNQSVTVYFSARVDPLTVSEDSFRVVDAEGHRVEGSLRIGTTSVTFVPVPPVRPSLDDGSFVDGRRYRLEVAGLPLFHGIRSAKGVRLNQRFDYPLVAARDESLATPFLPVAPLDGRAFSLMDGVETQMVADTGRLLLQFNRPILPTSVRPESVHVVALTETEQPIEPLSVEILPIQRAPTLAFGSTLALRLPVPRIDPLASYFVLLNDAPRFTLRDYLDRPLTGTEVPHRVVLVSGSRERVLQLGQGGDRWRLQHEAAGDAGPLIPFAVRGQRLVAQSVLEAGDGGLGMFRPRTDMTLQPGVPFDRGDGVKVVAATARGFEFSGIDIPSGVRVEVRSDEPVCIRSIGAMSIAGVLHLDTPRVPATWPQGIEAAESELVQRSGCAIVVGSHCDVAGRISHARAEAEGSPLTLIYGGDFRARGRLPRDVVVGADRQGVLDAVLESPTRVRPRLTPGLGGRELQTAFGQTEWIPIRTAPDVVLELDLVGASGSVDADVQYAPPHSVDTRRPDRRSGRIGAPVLVGEPLTMPRSGVGFVRITVRAEVLPGQELPSLGAVRLLVR